ncbi:hypothetical protein GUA87_01565 [Sneathiella sp. P13V-1]|uniref:SRPBCC family protein n=1 Tax=Sneathiella sp. P13V-1 TaxID=2697366 RepID=UPI00187B58C6|nr:SRPBCC domain-containing protein [Sneathiella sp. P13V-1]MBE7635516.1 hypothetical protein [Sneathiella sp. P13V-1]
MMTTSDYYTEFSTDAPIEEVFKCLTTGYGNWWTEPSHSFQAVGDQSKFAFGGESYWVFEAEELSPEHVRLKCTEAHLLLLDHPDEIDRDWLGSHLDWKMQSKPSGTLVKFNHEGLNDQLVCYDVCSRSWDHFLVDSLKSFLDTGVGKPHQVES